MAPTGPTHSKFERTSILPPAYAPSVSYLHTLKRCMFKGLAFETHHRGLYMILICVTPRSTMSVTVIAEDKDRDVAQLELHNQEAEITTDGRLSERTVMIIKDPYLKGMPDGE